MPNFLNLPPFTEDGDVHVVVETPRGSRVKFAYDPKLETFVLSKSLLTGLTYPHDWGFVPSTQADDGDPLDIMVIHDAATFPGIVLTCRIIGILQIEQKRKGKAERNDRLFAVPRRSHSEQGLRDVRNLSKPIQEELEKFFMQPTSSKTKNWRSSGGKAPRSQRRRSRTALRVSRRTASNSPQHQPGNYQAACPRCFREPSVSFARRLRSNASTVTSSGLRLSMPLRSSLSAFDLSSRTRLPSM
jgi:inorganic pyrophosphatase